MQVSFLDTTLFFSIFMIFYVYLGYPLLAAGLSRLLKKGVERELHEPTVTILISAYNEEDCIEQTITNKLALDYPKEKLEIIVVSDESEDKTDQIVQSFRNENVLYLRQSPRAGKTSALNMAIPHATGEIIVFSDANSIYASDALRQLVANFADSDVGYVTGKMIYMNPDGTVTGEGCSAYMKYENYLRKIETNIGSIVGVDGGIDAMRRSIFIPLNPDQLPDFVQPLKVIEQGKRVVYDPQAILKEQALSHAQDEYKMRVRVSLRALWALKDMQQLMWGKAGILFTWQLWSHKVLRYLCFLFLVGALFSNMLLLAKGVIYPILFLAQVACYISALVSPIIEAKGLELKFVRLCQYFVLLNVASGHAFIKFILGKKQVIWKPRKG